MALRKLLIIGGGSSGWITAAYLDAVLNGQSRKAVDITLIESPDVGRIGVGEATVPSLRDTMATIGVDEKTFMKAADATFKQAIKFTNWTYGNGDSYYHPFDRRPAGRLDRAGLKWLTSDRSRSFAETVSIQPALCDGGLAPKLPDSGNYQAPLSYAYHVDAEKLADYLMARATGRGVTHIQDFVTDVDMTEDGAIAAVRTKSGARHEADLFIDCTGFASLLISKALKVPFEDYSRWLLCDRAVAMRVPHDVHFSGSRPTYTISTALSSGWVWDVSLANRRGIGYVYSSQFIDDEAAEKELRAFEGSHTEQLAARQLKFRVGRCAAPWTKNCVAIGLSSGFIEPLESTGLFFVELAVATLAEYFPFTSDMSLLAARFNHIMKNSYEETLDFIALHYCLTRRTDTAFWQEVQKAEHIPERLQNALAMWQYKSPSFSDCHNGLQLFSHHTYEYVMYGMDFQREKLKGHENRLPKTQIPDDIAGAVNAARDHLMGHEDWLKANLGTAYTTSRATVTDGG